MEPIEQKVFSIITVKRLTKPLITLFILFVLASITVIYLAALSAFKKLDDDTVYNVDVISEAFEYVISANNSPGVLLRNFTSQLQQCKSTQTGKLYDNATIRFKRDVKILIERKSTSALKLTAVTLNPDSQSLGTLVNQFERCKLGTKAVFSIILNEDNPVFSMKVVGALQVGRVLSDASDDYYPLVNSGQIVIQDKTTFSKSPLTLSPQVVRPGDTVLLNQAEGVIRAQHENSGLTGVFSQQGSVVKLQHLYAPTAESVSPSFIDRVTSDSELAFALSISFVFLQFIGFGITTLFRLALFSGAVPAPGEKWIVRKRKKEP
ncbi:MAG: hypothetical protein KKE30_02725 [Gammaproteobacteria bacterium]|nr:hypothetical protein [Gammaproteobacteria bacterium]MBU1554180.1 hypothetical protein [Gammaproteobacteria bacterium]MBU2071497.1 hypothetical protein [Gammaproteobacteria bacterium]MBU2183988.1 hypothetical protein [Gammaproteobacteria bacterium]MBU2206926.1 hypothetical protein [Gammaproteobacteria bacterium]